MTATVVVPQFGHAELTVRCVQSLVEHHPNLHRVLVIDDGSETSHLDFIRSQRFPRCEILRNQVNRGVTAAWNLATSFARTEFLIFLNNDTLTFGNWCEALVRPLRSRHAFITGAQTRSPVELSSRLQGSVRFFLSGWCFAIRRSVLNDLDGFDPQLRLYFSDTDLQVRIARRFGADAMKAVPNLPIQHAAHQTTSTLPSRRLWWHRDHNCFQRKWSRREGWQET